MFEYQFGTAGDDYLTGHSNEDVFFGYAGNDTIVDVEESNDIVYAGDGDDWIFTGPGDDYAYGYSGNDTIFGASGSDSLSGNDGNDLLIGAYVVFDDPGKGDIDTLTGGNGNDTFILGEGSRVFYDSDFMSGLGTQDYALVTDFEPGLDTIQLHGSSSDYVIGGSGISDISGLGIYYLTGSNFELIGVLEDASSFDVSLTDSSQFTYVS